MIFRSLLISSLLALPAIAQEKSPPRTFQVQAGTINLEALGEQLSIKLKGKVEIESMRLSYNPIRRAFNYYDGYNETVVVNFTINAIHEVSCLLSVDDHFGRSFLRGCESETADIGFVTTISNNLIGIPPHASPLEKFGE